MPQSSSVGRRLARFALDRLGFGPRPESIEEVTSRGLQRWLEDQLQPSEDGELLSRLRSFPSLGESISEVIRRYEADPRTLSQSLADFRSARVVRAVHGKNQLEEVLTDFWFNHFNVFIGDPLVRLGIVRYELDAVRPHVLGRFRDLLGAVANSWSMMTYLDNYLSTARNINENYARELMELHTLGVDGGYTQQDVEEVSRALTGWGIDRSGSFLYRNNAHDQGAKTILGQRLPAGQGKRDGEDVLDILARHPSTARFLSLKLARRFVSDDPPPSLVSRCSETFTRTSGDIAEVMRTLLSSEEFWGEAFGPGKIKTPQEYVLSALRAVGAEVTSARSLVEARGTVSLAAMGMPPYESLDPTGWSDRGSDWIPNPGSHLARMNFALRLVSETIEGISVDIRDLIGDADPSDAAASTDAVDRRIFAGLLPAEVRAACSRVSASGALRPAFKVIGVALASPAFQVR
jgi:uncharacterized protein (DUF1800 family)